VGYFSIREVRDEESPFGKQCVYIGTMKCFKTVQGDLWRNLPCRIYAKKATLSADADYLVEGTITGKRDHFFVCKTKGSWKKFEGTFSFAQWRYDKKKTVYRYFRKQFNNPKVVALFSALSIGSVEERQLVNDFRKLGLSHILAISGFHFALYAGLLFLILRPILPTKIASSVALIILSGYLFFLGASPSVFRAWAAISLVLISRILGTRTTGLNALGVGLIAELLLDPLLVSSLSFQMSFLATTAILFLYAPCEKLLQKLFVLRSMSQLKELSFLHRHLYLLSSLLRKSMALNLSVHLITIPICLLHFHSFPFFSLLYNLFFPFLISLSMIGLLAGTMLHLLVPGVGEMIHRFNKIFTEKSLVIIAHAPTGGTWHISDFSPWIFSLWALTAIFICIIFDKKRGIPL
jgi:competence protein ComEC